MKPQNRLIAGVLAAVTIGAATVAFGVALLLGNIVHLQPTQAAESQLPEATVALEQTASRDGAYLARATALAETARSYMSSYVPDVARAVTTNPKAASSLATTARGKQLVDGIRGQTEQLEHLLSTRQAARQRSARSSANAAVVVLVVLTGLTLALGGFLGWLLVGRERARERAAFLADAGTQLDRGATSAEVLETFAALAVGRGNGYCAAEELDDADSVIPVLELGHASSGDAGIVPPGDRPAIEAAWEQARLLARTRRATSTHGATLESEHGEVQVLALAAMARGGLIARVVLARRGRSWGREEIREISGLGTRLALALEARALQARTEALYRRSDHVVRTLQQSLLPSLVLYADGVTDPGPEAERSPELVLRGVSTAPTAGALADALRDIAVREGSVPRDDVAIVALRYQGSREDHRPAERTGRRTAVPAG